MKAYRIKNDKIIGYRTIKNSSELLENEIEGDFVRPNYVNGELVETWTQADQTAEDERLEMQTVADLLDKFQSDGKAFYIEVRNLTRYHQSKGTITDSQYKSIRVTLEPALRPLTLGDWDIAQDNINAINRPTGVLEVLYDKVKSKIDSYLEL